MPSMPDELANSPPSTGGRLGLKPALARATPGVAGPVPGATRQMSVLVKAYSPLSWGGSAAAIVAQVTATAATEQINVRCMESPHRLLFARKPFGRAPMICQRVGEKPRRVYVPACRMREGRQHPENQPRQVI